MLKYITITAIIIAFVGWIGTVISGIESLWNWVLLSGAIAATLVMFVNIKKSFPNLDLEEKEATIEDKNTASGKVSKEVTVDPLRGH